MKTSFLRWEIERGEFNCSFIALYGADSLEKQRLRYIDAIDAFSKKYGNGHIDNDIHVFSVPGRSEICGNHTDHNCGLVIGCAVDIDLIVVASPITEHTINVVSKGFGSDAVNIDTISPNMFEKNTTAALIAGVCEGFEKNGHKIGGFNAYVTSAVKKGSGLSSSAAFEAAIGTVLNFYYNDDKIDAVEIAKISQYAERIFFGKACGLMDQVICSIGGMVMIDFQNEAVPKIEKLDIDFSEFGYSMCITDTGGNHSALSEDYSAVPYEMKSVAEYFGKSVLRGLTAEELIDSISELREKVGDRAILRAFHFINENDRVFAIREAMAERDITEFLRIILASGKSSEQLLQNIYSPKSVANQGISLALALSERFLADKKAAWRVHGGGFAGTVQAFVPDNIVGEFRGNMEKLFGIGACAVMHVRYSGAMRVF